MKMSKLRKAQLKMLEGLIEIDRICKIHKIDYWLDAGTLLGAARHGGFIPWDDDIDICMTRKDLNIFKKACVKSLDTNKFFLQTVTTDKNYNFINIPCKLRINNTHIIEDFELEHNCYNKQSHHGLYVDIFPYDLYSENIRKRKIQRLFSYTYKLKKLSYCDNIGFIKYIVSRIISPILPIKILEKITNTLSYKLNSNPQNTLFGAGIETPFERAYFNKNEIFPTKKITFENYSFSAPNNLESYLKKMFGDNYMQLPPEKNRIPHANLDNMQIDL